MQKHIEGGNLLEKCASDQSCGKVIGISVCVSIQGERGKKSSCSQTERSIKRKYIVMGCFFCVHFADVKSRCLSLQPFYKNRRKSASRYSSWFTESDTVDPPSPMFPKSCGFEDVNRMFCVFKEFVIPPQTCILLLTNNPHQMQATLMDSASCKEISIIFWNDLDSKSHTFYFS